MFTNTYLLKVSSDRTEQEIDQALNEALLELSKGGSVSIAKVASIKKEGNNSLSESNE
ncbi:hypothetical protein [Bacillus horti]|uniref:Uncharacterized protein n=1 Tax=Caldalkalibacillus horti TaxID=77523 RepID=A0ABT9VY59_9BACI|nr:hypothetical protein [Bacillus horti]MDQ0165928.1 hypothetical protein [Bacillus horti]